MKIKLPLLQPDDLLVLQDMLMDMLLTRPQDLPGKCMYACLAEFYGKVAAKAAFPLGPVRIRVPLSAAAAMVYAFKTMPAHKNPYAYATRGMIISEIDRQIK